MMTFISFPYIRVEIGCFGEINQDWQYSLVLVLVKTGLSIWYSRHRVKIHKREKSVHGEKLSVSSSRP